MKAKKRGWRFLHDKCDRRWIYYRGIIPSSGRLSLPVMEFKTREEAIKHARLVYEASMGWWHSWAELAVILESPEGAREKYELQAESARMYTRGKPY